LKVRCIRISVVTGYIVRQGVRRRIAIRDVDDRVNGLYLVDAFELICFDITDDFSVGASPGTAAVVRLRLSSTSRPQK
jgi:hypothetical protein